MRELRIDRWLGVGLTVIALVWLWLVQTYIPGAQTEGEPGPRGFPILLGVTLAGLGALLAGRSFLTVRSSASTRPEARAGDGIAALTRRECAFVAGTFGLLILYTFLLDKVGFLAGTPIVMVLALAVLLRSRRWLSVVSLAVGFTWGAG